MSFINNIRRSIALAITPKTVTVDATPQQLAKARSVTSPVLSRNHHILDQASRSTKAEAPAGRISVSDLDSFSSLYLKDAIASYAAWCALAAAFSEYERVTGRKNSSDVKLGTLTDEFHCWNASLPENKQMDETAIVDAVAKLCTPKQARSSEASDTIIARVRGCSVEELRAARMKDAETQAKRRQDLMDGFLAHVWSFTSSDLNPTISGARAEAKALDTMKYVSESWTGNPEAIAAELLLMEDDVKKLRFIAHQETLREGQGQAMDIGTFHGRREYKHDPALEESFTVRMDKQAFQEWQAAQQAQ